jgi:hypothetical protein
LTVDVRLGSLADIADALPNDVDRHGKPRFYFRRRGFKRVALPSLPWSPEFMAAYEAALAGQGKLEIGASRTIPGNRSASG